MQRQCRSADLSNCPLACSYASSRKLKFIQPSLQVLHTEFDFRRIRFELDREIDVFVPVQFPDSNPVDTYLESTGFASEADALAALEKWGTNTVNVPVPPFLELLKEQMMAPFFVFQVPPRL